MFLRNVVLGGWLKQQSTFQKIPQIIVKGFIKAGITKVLDGIGGSSTDESDGDSTSSSDETPDIDECDSATGKSIVAGADSSVIVID